MLPRSSGLIVRRANGRVPIAVARHGGVLMICGLPVRRYGRLRLSKAYLSGANETLQLHLEAILAPCLGPGLQLQIVESTGMATECERHDVIELVGAGC
jgi:hypothetical protein